MFETRRSTLLEIRTVPNLCAFRRPNGLQPSSVLSVMDSEGEPLFGAATVMASRLLTFPGTSLMGSASEMAPTSSVPGMMIESAIWAPAE